jgi:hypothetical protein
MQHLSHFNIINEVLAEYYPKGGLQVVDIPFNISSLEDLDEWNSGADQIVAGLSEWHHVVVIITDHSHPENGDLWLGVDEEGEPGAGAVEDVSAGLSYYFIPILTMNITVDEHYFGAVQECP